MHLTSHRHSEIFGQLRSLSISRDVVRNTRRNIMAPVSQKMLRALQNSRMAEITRMHTRFGDIAPENLTRNIFET